MSITVERFHFENDTNIPIIFGLVVLKLLLFSFFYILAKYPIIRNWYMAFCKTLLKILMDVLIALYSLFGFLVYSFYALVGLFTVKGFATDV